MEIRRKVVFFAFLVPIITVAFVSISHVTSWYSVANPLKWATYLSVGIEVAALSALAGFSVNLGRLLYPPLILVTIIQFIGNVFYNFQFIDIESELFKDWVDLSSPLLYFMGIEENDLSSHKRILAVLEGGFLPAISLFFLHLLMKLQDLKDDDRTKNSKLEENTGEETKMVTTDTKITPEIIVESEKIEPQDISNFIDPEITYDSTALDVENLSDDTSDINVLQHEEVLNEAENLPEQVNEEKKIKKLYYTK